MKAQLAAFMKQIWTACNLTAFQRILKLSFGVNGAIFFFILILIFHFNLYQHLHKQNKNYNT